MKTSKTSLSSALLGVLAGLALTTLACTGLAQTTNVIVLTTFEPGQSVNWSYGYYFGNNGLGGYTGPIVPWYSPDDPDMTNALMRYEFDTSALAGNTSYGTGFGGDLHWSGNSSLFTSSNLNSYLFSFDARVEGLVPGQTSANLQMEVRLFDASGNAIVYVDLPVTAGTNMTHYSFNLSQGSIPSWSGTTLASFIAGYQGVAAIRCDLQALTPWISFGSDSDNAIVIGDLELDSVDAVSVQQPPLVGQPVLNWNLDDSPMFGLSGFTYGLTPPYPVVTYPTTWPGDFAGWGVGGSNGWYITCDNSAIGAGYAGAGFSGHGPTDYTRFNTGDLSLYRLSFVAEAFGLAPGVSSTPATVSILVDSTNGNLELDFSDHVVAGTNWTTNTFILNTAVVEPWTGSAPMASFATNYSTYKNLRLQWQLDNLDQTAIWGVGAGKGIAVDNITLERMSVGIPPLSISDNGKHVVLTWADPTIGTGTTILLHATSPIGPWSEVVGATSGYTTPNTGAPSYFRTQWVPTP